MSNPPTNPASSPTATPEPPYGTAANGGDTATSVAERFGELVRSWKRETAFMSSLTEKKAHPAYQQIIGFGQAAVPLILAELRREPDFWFRALKTITGEDPVQPADRGQVRRMAQAWLEWGAMHGY